MKATPALRIARVTLLAVLAFGLMTLGLVFGPPTGAWAQIGGEARMRLWDGERIQQLDPAMMGRAVDWTVAMQIYSGLVRFKPGTAEYEPDLAER
jgi:ABC-type transport system substrate-binding protein